MAGIERIRIVSDWQDWRTEMQEELSPTANELYRIIFASLGMGLLTGDTNIECTKEQAKARYDWQEGIDVILNFARGGRATLQEKFLTFGADTVTFEEEKTSGAKGAWYYCTAQYYFVGYAKLYRTNKVLSFQNWMLVNLPQLRIADAAGKIRWGEYNNPSSNPLGIRRNTKDGRRASFRYVYFRNVPADCIVASGNGKTGGTTLSQTSLFI